MCRSFQAPACKVQVSSQGGSKPLWARNGRELFYLSGDKMMAVDITTEPSFQPPLRESSSKEDTIRPPMGNYDVTADGRRFLWLSPAAPRRL